jgi:hypothetical protein
MVTQRTHAAARRPGLAARPAASQSLKNVQAAVKCASSGKSRPGLWQLLPILLLSLLLNACASTQVRTVKGDDGKPLIVNGSVVLVSPDVELYEVLAGGATEPRKEWTETARRLYPQMARELLNERGIDVKPEFAIPAEAGADDRLRQMYLLNQAVSISILQYGRSTSSTGLRNKHGKFDWTLGPGVSELREATGADYAMFTYIRDSYTSGGRAAMRIIGFLLLGGDIGGGFQIGLASLVDLRTGQVVWHNLLVDQAGDLRDERGARETAGDLLKGLGPKPPPKPPGERP